MPFLAMIDLSPLLWWIGVIVKVAVGLGAVIFVHELGHYLVALACGVKIEKFMVGFDIGGLKLSRKWGETVYGIGIVPLGGYVKFLGQDDDPAHIAEQMQKSQVDVENPNAKAITGPNGETYYVDRRSYMAKSVPQRMAIISAGVVMNVIFAFIFAVIAFGMGVPYLPSIVSETSPGSPAWRAGLAPGDEIVQIGNRQDPSFTQLKGGITLGNLEEGIPILVHRAADDQTVPMTLRPTQESGRLATIGVSIPQSLTINKNFELPSESPAANAKLVSGTPPAAKSDDAAKDEKEKKDPRKLSGGDTIVRVGDTAVTNFREFSAELAKNQDLPMQITIERPVAKQDGSAESNDTAQTEKPIELKFEVAPTPLRNLPVVMKMGPIVGVQVDSPAEDVGLKAGDLIELVDGQSISDGTSESKGWDPITLPEYFRKAGSENREVELVVKRVDGDKESPVTIRVKPGVPTAIHSMILPGTPMPAEAIGVVYNIENEVQAVRADSKAKIAAGDKVIAAKIIQPKKAGQEEPSKPEVTEFRGEGPNWISSLLGSLLGREAPKRPELQNWPALVDALRFAPAGTEIELTVERGEPAKEQKFRLTPYDVEGMFVAPRGFAFEPIIRTQKAATFADQVWLGWDETTESLGMVFRFLQKLGTQVPITALGGPVTIAKAAGYSASEGLSSLLIFLTMLSANLAVINLLPIPILDGGHLVFLAYEGIRGRPASERFVVALHMAGFVFIVGLMLFVLALDVGIVPRNL